MTHFNQIANTWDTQDKIEQCAVYANRIKTLLTNKTPAKILEVGCGTGLLGSNFITATNTLIGVDTSDGMLEVFNQKFQSNKNVKSILLNLEKENLNESNFDLIISSMAFHHLNNPKYVLSKLKKLLSPSGVIAIIDLDLEDGSFHPDPKAMGVHHFGFSKNETNAWGTEANLKTIHREIISSIDKNQKKYPLFLCLFSL